VPARAGAGWSTTLVVVMGIVWPSDGRLMRTSTSVALLAAALLAAPAVVHAAAHETPAPERTRIEIPGCGALSLRLPFGWHHSIEAPTASLPTIASFRAPAGETLMISVFSNVRAEPGFNTASSTRASVEESGRSLLSTAVESTLSIRELQGTSHQGYFFSLTDKALVGKPPQPDDFKFLTSGEIGVGKLHLLFTILSNDRDSTATKAALEVVRTAAYEP